MNLKIVEIPLLSERDYLFETIKIIEVCLIAGASSDLGCINTDYMEITSPLALAFIVFLVVVKRIAYDKIRIICVVCNGNAAAANNG